MMVAPLAARTFAMAWPIPLAAPDTQQTLPAKLEYTVVFMDCFLI
jgi:hypothetical protein